MGLLDNILRRNKELTWMYDLDMFEDDTKRIFETYNVTNVY